MKLKPSTSDSDAKATQVISSRSLSHTWGLSVLNLFQKTKNQN